MKFSLSIPKVAQSFQGSKFFYFVIMNQEIPKPTASDDKVYDQKLAS
jgi:hypothetical protein